jgi:hypothetical protein
LLFNDLLFLCEGVFLREHEFLLLERKHSRARSLPSEGLARVERVHWWLCLNWIIGILFLLIEADVGGFIPLVYLLHGEVVGVALGAAEHIHVNLQFT